MKKKIIILIFSILTIGFLRFDLAEAEIMPEFSKKGLQLSTKYLRHEENQGHFAFFEYGHDIYLSHYEEYSIFGAGFNGFRKLKIAKHQIDSDKFKIKDTNPHIVLVEFETNCLGYFVPSSTSVNRETEQRKYSLYDELSELDGKEIDNDDYDSAYQKAYYLDCELLGVDWQEYETPKIPEHAYSFMNTVELTKEDRCELLIEEHINYWGSNNDWYSSTGDPIPSRWNGYQGLSEFYNDLVKCGWIFPIKTYHSTLFRFSHGFADPDEDEHLIGILHESGIRDFIIERKKGKWKIKESKDYPYKDWKVEELPRNFISYKDGSNELYFIDLEYLDSLGGVFPNQ